MNSMPLLVSNLDPFSRSFERYRNKQECGRGSAETDTCSDSSPPSILVCSLGTSLYFCEVVLRNGGIYRYEMPLHLSP